MEKPRSDQVIFRLNAEEHQLLSAYARVRPVAGQAYRDLTIAGLRGSPAAPPTFVTAAGGELDVHLVPPSRVAALGGGFAFPAS
jgi:hypothetical protein